MKLVGLAFNVAVISVVINICNPDNANAIEAVDADELTKYIETVYKQNVSKDVQSINYILDAQITQKPVSRRNEKVRPYLVMQFYEREGWAEVDRYETIEQARAVKQDIINRLRAIGSKEAVNIHVEVH